MPDTLSELTQLVERHTSDPAVTIPRATAVGDLTLMRSDQPRLPLHRIYKPALCVVLQGAKWTLFGEQRFEYSAGQALLVGVEMPGTGRVTQASLDAPYLGLVVELDPAVLREVMNGLTLRPAPERELGRGVFLTDFGGPLSESVLRLVRLLDTPAAIPALAPLAMRELCYWLLSGPHGAELACMLQGGHHGRRVIDAVHALRGRFHETVRTRELADLARLSPSAFHRQFKALTSMTPLQYQKRLRLLEARHLLFAGLANAETAAFQVGYQSASQFSREYARMFGAPPRRDLRVLRAA